MTDEQKQPGSASNHSDGVVPASGASARVPLQFREGLTRGEAVVDTATWVGSVPAATGVAPRVLEEAVEVDVDA